MTQKEILKKMDLDWDVRAEKIMSESGIIIPQIALVRDDTNVHLSTRSIGYEVFQNEQLLELLFQISQKTSLKIHKGGHFSNGAKVYMQLKSDDLKLGDDLIEGYITGINSFDGSTSLAFGHSNLTISCQNKFFSVFRNLETKLRHTKNLNIKIDEICKQMDTILLEEKNIFGDIKKLSEERYTEKNLQYVLDTLFKPTNDLNKDNGKRANNIEKFMLNLNLETNQKGDNLWGLFSGVTKYTTHIVNTKDNIENKIFGRYGEIERTIYKNLVELV